VKLLAPIPLVLALLFSFLAAPALAAGSQEPTFHSGEYGLSKDQYASFPKPLAQYAEVEEEDWSMWDKLKYRATQQGGFNLVATIIFICAILHTFLSGYFIEMAHHHEKAHQKKIEEMGLTGQAKPHDDAEDDVSFKANLFHFLGEVEAVFGIWVIALAGAILWFFGIQGEGLGGKDVNFTEPLFVVIIMAIAATRPVIRFAEFLVDKVAKVFGGTPAAWWFSALTITPLLGSFITEPAAMTIAAFLLSKKFYDLNPSPKFAYATLGLLFVNISVGGTLTHFAAPPVLMIAEKWSFGMGYMFLNFGWKAAIGILISNALYFYAFRSEFSKLKPTIQTDMHVPLKWSEREDPIPTWITVAHLLFLAWTVIFAHDPPLFIGGFLFFLGFSQATGHHQNEVNMKSPVLVGFFLAGLVIHGGCQGWWISVLLTSIDNDWILMIGSTLLTAVNDNAAITYLASQAPGLSIGAKYAIVAGAVTGGGLTVIANAPNPAGQSILGRHFKGGVAPIGLIKSAAIPTIILGACFMLLPSSGRTNDPQPASSKEATMQADGEHIHQEGNPASGLHTHKTATGEISHSHE